jgi:hypothetical protein
VGDSQQIQVPSESYYHFSTLSHSVLKSQKQWELWHRLFAITMTVDLDHLVFDAPHEMHTISIHKLQSLSTFRPKEAKILLGQTTAAGGRTPGNDIITPSQCTILRSDGYNRHTEG